MQQRFPLRTLILMALTLVAFVWFYWSTHRPPQRAQVQPREVQEVELVPGDGGAR